MITLSPGNFYFTIDGSQTFIYGRNLTGMQQSDFDAILDWSKSGGAKLARIRLTHGLGMGMKSAGVIDETWAGNWEQVFDKAEANGICIIPVFGVWADWNNGTPNCGFQNWNNNPLNNVNNGPAASPGDLFTQNSTAQNPWLQRERNRVNMRDPPRSNSGQFFHRSLS